MLTYNKKKKRADTLNECATVVDGKFRKFRIHSYLIYIIRNYKLLQMKNDSQRSFIHIVSSMYLSTLSKS